MRYTFVRMTHDALFVTGSAVLMLPPSSATAVTWCCDRDYVCDQCGMSSSQLFVLKVGYVTKSDQDDCVYELV